MEILPADSNNRRVIFFQIKLFLTGSSAGENHDVMIGYYSSQMIEVLLTDECNQDELWTNFPLREIIWNVLNIVAFIIAITILSDTN